MTIELQNAYNKLNTKKEQLEYQKYIVEIFDGYTARQNLKEAEKEYKEAEKEYSKILDLVYPDPED